MAIVTFGNTVRNHKYDLSGNIGVTIKDSDVMIPVDNQTRYQKTIQTHAGVTLPATSGTNDSVWIDATGYNELGLVLLNSAATNNQMDIHWSSDGVNTHGIESPLATSVGMYRATSLPIRARYFRLRVYNTDGSARTMSTWATLKV